MEKSSKATEVESEPLNKGGVKKPHRPDSDVTCGWIRTCRWSISIMGFFVFVNLYALRVNMSVAMVCMINNTAVKLSRQELYPELINVTKPKISGDSENCYATRNLGNSSQVSESREGEFNWDKETQSLVLSSFFWGYVFTQSPAGWLAQRFGGQRVLGISMLIAVTSSLLAPIGARTSPYMLIALRVTNGLGQGAMFPVMHALFAKWAPPLERSKLIGFAYAGSQIGNVVALPVSALLCDYGFDGGWSSVFYVFGSTGAVVLVLWMIIVRDSPAQHPRITKEEREYIESSIGLQQSHPSSTPWLEFLKCIPFYAIIIAQFCVLWGSFTLLTNIPTYMKEILKFNIKSNGALSAIPYIAFWAFINAGGVLADYMRSTGFQTKNVRKLMLAVGAVVPAGFLIATGFVTCEHPYLAVALLTLALGFSGLHFPGVMVNHADIAPPFAAVMFGIANSIGTTSGIFAPMVVGALTPNGTQQEWQNVFYVSAAILTFGAIVFCLFADGEVQPWVRPYMENLDPTVKLSDTPFKSISDSIIDIHGSQCLRE